ncbi:MAG: tRNA lysidine(34) synthetase TilS [Planctomycetes bacterium]|nr:tRNA lysidine(34) synthetase TilS [Planctomycetota bacterium]
MNRYFDEVHAFARTYELFVRGESILIGFSGGPDSMFLAECLQQISSTYRYGWNITLAHLNHGITESADDNEKFCREIAESRLKLPLVTRRVSIPMMRDSGKYRGMSIEQLGRRERYRLFVDTCKQKSITKLATGHQLDDQSETVLMRAIAGSWLTGISGIPVRRPLSREMKTEVVRPLLRTGREQIEEWVKSENVPYFNDPSNTDMRYTRNKVRQVLMPLITKEFNPGARRHLAALGFQAQELEVEFQHLAAAFLDKPEPRGGQTIMRVSLEKLRSQGPLAQRYILREGLMAAGLPAREVTHRRVEQVRDLLGSERRGVVVKLNEKTGVLLDDANLVITVTHTTLLPESLAAAEFQITRDGTWLADVNRGPYMRISAEMMSMPDGGLVQLLEDKPPEVEYLDAEKVLFPLLVRGRKDGDRIQPLGLDGEKKIQDLLTDNKVAREERDLVPLICDSTGVICVCGQTISHRVRVTPTTRQLICINMMARSTGSDASGFMPPVTG